MRGLVMLTLVVALAVPVGGMAQPQTQATKDSVYEKLNLFDEAFERVRQDSVDPVPDKKLIGAAIAGMLSGLDPRAAYIDPAALHASQTPANDNEPGIGLTVTIDNGELKVISPRDGSPAAQAGIKPGDLIFSIDKEPSYELSLAEAEQKLHGPPGSTVKLTLRRASGGGPIRLTVKRTPYRFKTVAAHIADGDIGYIRIAGFDSSTLSALTAAVANLRQQAHPKLAGIALDLRNNAGGDFDAAVKLADAFLDKGDIAVIKGRKPDSVKHIAGTPGDLVKGLPVVAIVNGGTAREAELVAGALQSDHRAVLLGTKTFGDSDIETLIPLDSGGAIRLTTARFTPASGQEIEGKGLDPDLAVTPVRVEKLAEVDIRHEADLPGALKNPDQPPPPAGAPPGATATPPPKASPSVATAEIGSAGDEQLIQALDVLRGLAVFSGRASG